MSYPAASKVLGVTRALLLADASTGGDQIFTDARLLPFLGIAWREFWDALTSFGNQRPRLTMFWLLKPYTNAFYPQAAGLRGFTDLICVEEAAVDRSIDIASFSDSADGDEYKLTTNANHGLVTNDRAFVVNAGEGADGEWFTTVVDATNAQLNGSFSTGLPPVNSGRAKLVIASGEFTNVSPITTWARRPVAAVLGEYQWEGDRLRFHGASSARLLSINAYAAPPDAPVAPTDILRVENCENFLSYRTASLAAGAQGREDLSNRYAIMALGQNQRPDGSGGYLAGLVASMARSMTRLQSQRAA
ncbi:MAG: hypothetical protein QM757_26410 [Paludibaculum sp.]